MLQVLRKLTQHTFPSTIIYDDLVDWLCIAKLWTQVSNVIQYKEKRKKIEIWMCASFLCCLACNCMFFPWFINTSTNHALKFTVLKFYCSFICGVQCIRKEQKWKWMYSQNKFSMLTERCFYSETLLRTSSRMNGRIVSDWFASGWLACLDCLVFCPKLKWEKRPCMTVLVEEHEYLCLQNADKFKGYF